MYYSGFVGNFPPGFIPFPFQKFGIPTLGRRSTKSGASNDEIMPHPEPSFGHRPGGKRNKNDQPQSVGGYGENTIPPLQPLLPGSTDNFEPFGPSPPLSPGVNF